MCVGAVFTLGLCLCRYHGVERSYSRRQAAWHVARKDQTTLGNACWRLPLVCPLACCVVVGLSSELLVVGCSVVIFTPTPATCLRFMCQACIGANWLSTATSPRPDTVRCAVFVCLLRWCVTHDCSGHSATYVPSLDAIVVIGMHPQLCYLLIACACW